MDITSSKGIGSSSCNSICLVVNHDQKKLGVVHLIDVTVRSSAIFCMHVKMTAASGPCNTNAVS